MSSELVQSIYTHRLTKSVNEHVASNIVPRLNIISRPILFLLPTHDYFLLTKRPMPSHVIGEITVLSWSMAATS